MTVHAPLPEQLVMDLESDLSTVADEGVVEWCPSDVELKFRFNPRTDRGKAFAQINFKIVFLVQPGKLEETQETVQQGLARSESRCLELLTAWAMRDLASTDGRNQLEGQLRDELDDSLFSAVQGWEIARVKDILWTSYLVQESPQ